ncbi:aminopeptidase [Bacillus pakistanensis]|uniref:Aminopeptidase n=1 Tax=Rossellomorea pakistanensis TaxID=992288 RepID=A0ABS2N870_9BACI|nr:aminopeptidase [Bacillus pakistanensis]MBM7584062.1 aminopeptidase [Bacillus pakistanensis]
MNTFQVKLSRYADLILQVGLNLQKGQRLIIHAPISASSFVRDITSKAYDLGAKNVIVDYDDEQLRKIKIEKATDEGLKDFPQWKAKGYLEMAKENMALLNLSAPNPEIFQDSDPSRVALVNKTAGEAMKDFRQYISGGRINWLIAAIPTKEWAKTIFPELSTDDAVSKLWEQIFYTTRVDQEDPVPLWKEHISAMNTRADYLNRRKYKTLHYKGPGTDLTIDLHTQTKWLCAEFINDQEVHFVPNLPTEEVFTIPIKTGVNGTVSSTKPLNYGGNLIQNFSLTFKDGKVVDFQAEQGYEVLKNLLSADEGAPYLGEVALVPHDSPISNTGIVFNNTLFDENASCHIALGNALNICVEKGKNMTKEELDNIGFNDSIIHVDFMIGSGELDIEGERTDGTKEPIFRNGNWAF